MNKLQGKDLINIGIFTAIYFIVIFAAASIGFIPIFIPLISVIVPLVGGIPMMLFFSKIKKFGMPVSYTHLLHLLPFRERHPMSLSGGQKMCIRDRVYTFVGYREGEEPVSEQEQEFLYEMVSTMTEAPEEDEA